MPTKEIIDIQDHSSNAILPDELAVGIDFGTTNSLIAIANNSCPEIIKDKSGRELIPSTISFAADSKEFIIGNTVAGKNISTLRSIKRLFIKSRTEVIQALNLAGLEFIDNNSNTHSRVHSNNQNIDVIFNNDKFSLTDLATKIFTFLKEQAEEALATGISKAVISVPAYFDAKARGQILLSARNAGFEVMRLIAEPTAAAYAYKLNNMSKGSYLVYDLGGGTFDVSVLNMQTGILQVVASGGDNNLGGDDFDLAVARYLAKKENITFSYELITIAKELKEALSTKTIATVNLHTHELTLNNEEFNSLINPFIDKTIRIARDILAESECREPDGIILVGGSTRIPLIMDKLTADFNMPIFATIDPDKAVVMGAALQADNLINRNIRTKKEQNILIDVVPLSLGIELYGGITEKIIMRNTPIPFAVTKSFTTYADNQTGMQFHILQGEREMVKDCISLADFELTDLPLKPAGQVQVEVTFAIDNDGILAVTAKEVQTGILKDIVIKPTYGLTTKDINNRLKDAFRNAQNDHKLRSLAESRYLGEELIARLSKILPKAGLLIPDIEIREINKAIKSLQRAIKSDNQNSIINNTEKLNKLNENLMKQYLDKYVQENIKGKHIDEIPF